MKIINYPAMASPPAMECINNIIGNYCNANSTILDPFCGTGRLLTNPRKMGHNVIGVDCSPVALLSARVLHQKINLKHLDLCLETIIDRSKNNKLKIKVCDEELFWFEKKSYIQLVKILFSIESSGASKNTKRVFWLALVDAIRKISYLRENEYKLHRMKPVCRETWKPDALNIFSGTAKILFNKLSNSFKNDLIGDYRFHLGDIAVKANKFPPINAIITSPPYGDSRSTVGYGEFARIPLMILQLSKEFRDEYPINYLKNLDSVCLGGVNCVTKKSFDIPAQVEHIKGLEMKRFFEDYFGRLVLFDKLLEKNGIICFVLADRTYKGEKIQLINATSSFFDSLGYEPILKVDRMLSLKRLPRSMKHTHKTNTNAQTHIGMNYETILGFKKTIDRAACLV